MRKRELFSPRHQQQKTRSVLESSFFFLSFFPKFLSSLLLTFYVVDSLTHVLPRLLIEKCVYHPPHPSSCSKNSVLTLKREVLLLREKEREEKERGKNGSKKLVEEEDEARKIFSAFFLSSSFFCVRVLVPFCPPYFFFLLLSPFFFFFFFLSQTFSS